MQDLAPVEAQIAVQGIIAQPQQQKYDHIAGHDEFHQVGDAEIGMVICKAVHGIVQLFQS